MLTRLVIRNVALIDKAELDLAEGFTVVTGETGAGKSMLMDALSLALGSRGGAGFLRPNADEATVEATFRLGKTNPLRRLLKEQGISLEDDELVLRRVLDAEGKSRCFAGGLRVTQAQMKELGDDLADIHGQHDHQLLLRPASHPDLLDQFGRLTAEREAVEAAWRTWKDAREAREALETRAADRARDLDLLATYLTEIDTLAPQPGDEAALAAERARLMAGEQLVAAFAAVRDVLLGDADPAAALRRAERALAPLAAKAGPEIEKLVDRLAEASALVADVVADVDRAASRADPDPERLAEVDERLHALRACARKHKVAVDDLPAVQARLTAERDQLTNADENLAHLAKAEEKARAAFAAACTTLTAGRTKAAAALKGKIEAVLKTLKMEAARFEARLQPLATDDASRQGAERVAFYVSTYPGAPFAPLEKVASGGEVSRLMLALKTVFYDGVPSQTLVFDEIDTGIGGAVADAVGDCLRRIAQRHQVLAITHQPQVAAKGNAHLRIAKTAKKDSTVTRVDHLETDERRDEIARMLAGKHVTDAARKAADSLLKGPRA